MPRAKKEGAATKRPRTEITFNGKTQTISAWAREIGIKVATLYHRIKKLGWDVARALTEPARVYKRKAAVLAEAA